MEALLFFVLLVVALLVLNIIDMISKPSNHTGKPDHISRHKDNARRGVAAQGAHLARLRAQQRAALRAAKLAGATTTGEFPSPLE